MGSVHMETRNEGRGLHEWDYVPLSEERVVREQIKHRIRLDRAYAIRLGYSGLVESSGVSDIAEPILCTYLDLDRLIELSEMTEEQSWVVHLIMQGYTETDIAQERGCSRQAVCRLFRDGVGRIVAANNAQWRRFADEQLKNGHVDIQKSRLIY